MARLIDHLLLYERALQQRIETFAASQQYLKETLLANSDRPPVATYTDDLRSSVRQLQLRNRDSYIIQTSGTSSAPKELYYPQTRINRLKREVIDQVLLGGKHSGIDPIRPYFLTSLSADSSLSYALFDAPITDRARSRLVEGGLVCSAGLEQLTNVHPQLWIHLTLIIALQPTVLVAVNPSSLAILLNSAAANWDHAREKLSSTFEALTAARHPALNSLDVSILRQRIKEGAQKSWQEAAFSTIQGVCCWTGGYVRPYLELLRSRWRTELKIVPFPSLSTETVAGLIVPAISSEHSMPLYPGILYEGIPEKTQIADSPLEVRPITAFAPGERFSLVVSDRWGLSRYDTEDLFECVDRYHSVPLHSFIGRRGLSFSFTGEKITAVQLNEVYAQLQTAGFSAICCFPCATPATNELPAYRFVVAGDLEPHLLATLANEIDLKLSETNSEYRAKRQSNRLGPPKAVSSSLANLILAIDKHSRKQSGQELDCPHKSGSGANLAQIKLLPLYPKIDFSCLFGGI